METVLNDIIRQLLVQEAVVNEETNEKYTCGRPTSDIARIGFVLRPCEQMLLLKNSPKKNEHDASTAPCLKPMSY